MKRISLNQPKVKMIGGPWLYLIIGLFSLIGLLFALIKGKRCSSLLDGLKKMGVTVSRLRKTSPEQD